MQNWKCVWCWREIKEIKNKPAKINVKLDSCCYSNRKLPFWTCNKLFLSSRKKKCLLWRTLPIKNWKLKKNQYLWRLEVMPIQTKHGKHISIHSLIYPRNLVVQVSVKSECSFRQCFFYFIIFLGTGNRQTEVLNEN